MIYKLIIFNDLNAIKERFLAGENVINDYALRHADSKGRVEIVLFMLSKGANYNCINIIPYITNDII